MTDNELAFLRDDPEMADLFLAESLDHLATIEAALLVLDERPGDVTLLNDIFRPFHTIKGNAGALGVTSVQEVAHRVENLLDLARSGRRAMGPADVDVVLRAVDVLTSMIRDIGARLSGQPGADLAPVAEALIASVDMLISGEAAAHAARKEVIGEPAKVEAAPETAGAGRRGEDLTAIKVDTRKLDSLVDAVGELIIVQSLIQEDPLLAHVDHRLAGNLGQLKRITAGLQRSAMALRMVPIRQAFQKVSRIVRDLSRKANKSVELVLTGARSPAAEAHRIGLVNRVVPLASLVAETRAMADAMLRNGPLALAAALEVIQHGLEVPLEEGLLLEANAFAVLCATEDMREGLQAFLEKRKAAFNGR